MPPISIKQKTCLLKRGKYSGERTWTLFGLLFERQVKLFLQFANGTPSPQLQSFYMCPYKQCHRNLFPVPSSCQSTLLQVVSRALYTNFQPFTIFKPWIRRVIVYWTLRVAQFFHVFFPIFVFFPNWAQAENASNFFFLFALIRQRRLCNEYNCIIQ